MKNILSNSWRLFYLLLPCKMTLADLSYLVAGVNKTKFDWRSSSMMCSLRRRWLLVLLLGLEQATQKENTNDWLIASPRKQDPFQCANSTTLSFKNNNTIQLTPPSYKAIITIEIELLRKIIWAKFVKIQVTQSALVLDLNYRKYSLHKWISL
jgi:hypothetical protein